MFSSLLNWCYGYHKLKDVDTPVGATHMLVIRGAMKARKYFTAYKFKYIHVNEIVIPYNLRTNTVYDDTWSKFDKLHINEFVHLVIPNTDAEVNYIPIENYEHGYLMPSYSDYFQKDDHYICSCKNNSYRCPFHKFLIENLYTKYKNVVTENPNIRGNINNSGCLDQSVC